MSDNGFCINLQTLANQWPVHLKLKNFETIEASKDRGRTGDALSSVPYVGLSRSTLGLIVAPKSIPFLVDVSEHATCSLPASLFNSSIQYPSSSNLGWPWAFSPAVIPNRPLDLLGVVTRQPTRLPA